MSHSGEFQYVARKYTKKGKFISEGAITVADLGYTHLRILPSLNSGIAYACGLIRTDCSSFGGSSAVDISTFHWLSRGAITYTPPQTCVVSRSGSLDLQLRIQNAPVYFRGKVYACGADIFNTEAWIRRWPAPGQQVTTGAYDAANGIIRSYTNDTGDACDIAIGDDGDIYVMVSESSNVPPTTGGLGVKMLKFSPDLVLLHAWYGAGWGITPRWIPGFSSFAIYRNHLITYNGNSGDGTYTISGNTAAMYAFDSADLTLTSVSYINPLPGLTDPNSGLPSAATPIIDIGGGYAVFRAGVLSFNGGQATLAQIVGDISKRCGMTDDDYDVREIPDPVRGFGITNQTSGRANIQALMPAFFFAGVESDTFVKWRHLFRASAGSIPNNDLGAHLAGEDTPKLLAMRRGQEVDLPRRVFVKYLDAEADYQDGVQLWQRQSTLSQVESTVELPVVLTGTEAKAIVDQNGANTWMERTEFTFYTPRKYAFVEPLDVVTVQGVIMRITAKEETAGGVIKFTAVATSKTVFFNNADGTPSGIEGQDLALPQKSDLIPLDIPLPVDGAFQYGYPVLMAGSDRQNWKGARLYSSSDDGASYATIYTAQRADTFGTTSSKLGDFTDGNVFDEINSVTVVLTPGSGTLSSASRSAVLNGANLCLIGDELLQYRNATLTDTRTYVLSGLLRGRRGTEFAISTHLSSDRFAVLPAANNYESPSEDIGLARKLKAVTIGNNLTGATAVDFTNTAIALRPYSPVQLGGGYNGSGDITLNWVRRTRIGGAWRDLAEVPLSEERERYIVEIWDSTYSLCARVITVDNAQTTTYTSAMQTTDFGAQQQDLYFTVLQVGRVSAGVRARGLAAGAGASDVAPLAPTAPYAFPTGVTTPPDGTGTVNLTYSSLPHYEANISLASGKRWVGKFHTTSGTLQGVFWGIADTNNGGSGGRHVYIATDVAGLHKVAGTDVYNAGALGEIFSIAITSGMLANATDYYFVVDYSKADGSLYLSAGTISKTQTYLALA